MYIDANGKSFGQVNTIHLTKGADEIYWYPIFKRVAAIRIIDRIPI